MKKLCLNIAVAMVSCIGLFATSASAANRTVNCDEGQSIQDALEKGQGSAAPLYIDVSGSCEEVVTITRDDVTIDGDETATVIGTIIVEGGRRINISAITITGPGPGVVAAAGYLKLRNVVITGNSGTGVFATQSAYVGVLKSTVSNNDQGGVLASDGSSVFVRNTSINGHDGDGIRLSQGAIGTVGKSIISGNFNGIEALAGTVVIEQNTTISGNANHGIDADFHSSVQISDSAVSNNDQGGVLGRNGSSVIVDNTYITDHNEMDGITILSNATARLERATISGNFNGIGALIGTVVIGDDTTISGNANHGIDADFHSSVQISDSAITNNGVMGIKLELDSGLITFDNVTISGNGDFDVFCGDTESSFQTLSFIDADVECTDFNQFAP